MAKQLRFTLYTNIEFVQHADLRLYCNAVLLEENQPPLFGEGLRSQLRGFGPDSAWPIFTIWLKPEQLPLTIKADVQDNSKLMEMGGKFKPLFSGATMTLADGTVFFLQASDAARPLDIFTCEGQDKYELLWDTLDEKTSAYWYAPNMPYLSWAPPRRGLR